ncbi:hypothetical protein GEMRC1_009971 [Eukaryota sp. GEM-RC1]
MQGHSCYICKTIGPFSIHICCDRYVCLNECLDLWRSSSHPCDSCNFLPSSFLAAPRDVLSCSTNRSSSPSIASPNSIHLPHSLLVLVKSHLLNRMYKSYIETPQPYNVNTHAFNQLFAELPSFFEKVGYVSQRFFESCFTSIRVFFETNTFSMTCEHLPLVFASVTLFGLYPQSVYLDVNYAIKSDDVCQSLIDTSIVTHLRAYYGVHFDLHRLLDNSSSSSFLSRLRVLEVTKIHNDYFCSFVNL